MKCLFLSVHRLGLLPSAAAFVLAGLPVAAAAAEDPHKSWIEPQSMGFGFNLDPDNFKSITVFTRPYDPALCTDMEAEAYLVDREGEVMAQSDRKSLEGLFTVLTVSPTFTGPAVLYLKIWQPSNFKFDIPDLPQVKSCRDSLAVNLEITNAKGAKQFIVLPAIPLGSKSSLNN